MNGQSRILIIDDEEVVLDSCLQILAGGNYRIATAQDGAAGLQLTQTFAPDLVMIDLKMPGISGFEVLEKVRAADPTIVVVVITGYSTVDSAVAAMKGGAFDFLPKPFTPDELRLITARGLERRRLVLESIALRREREMLQENFAAIVSHELRSPLSAVQQNLYALAAELSGGLTEAQRNRFDRIKSRLDDLLKLIQGWLRAVSVPVAKMKDGFTPVSVRGPISRAIETVQPHATRKDIEITESVAEPLPLVLGDEGGLAEALVNLLGNAIKYTHPGGKVSVVADAGAGRVRLSVADTGVGISPEDLPFVFDAFYRGSASPGAEPGVGLGLALARRIVEAHDGTLSVESEPGKGTTFFISLPIHGADGHGPPAKAAAAPSTKDSGDTR